MVDVDDALLTGREVTASFAAAGLPNFDQAARMMQLQSKVYEATTTYTLVIFLNVVAYFDTIHGLQPEIQELAICAAASVADWALNEGYAAGLYANTLMFIPEEKVPFDTKQGAEETQELDATMAIELKRRRIHLPPSTSEDQRKRIMDMLVHALEQRDGFDLVAWFPELGEPFA